MTFDTLGLSKKVLQAVEASGYTTPTPIQEQAIPHVLERRDVLGIAQTGTGKTASFVLPMLSLLEKGRARARMPRTLILEPTRELAAQVHENFKAYGKNHKLNVALLIGGVSFDEQFRILDRGADVLIATPGRLLDHYERGKLLMTGVEILIIDEADRMLDMGFIPDIERIVQMVPFTRQTLLFSATMPPEIEKLANQFLQNPVSVSVAPPSSASKTIAQHACASAMEDYEKRALLRSLIDNAEALQNAIIFCNRKVDVANLYKSLMRHEYSCGALHGDMDQTSRTATLKAFKDGKIKLLVASDVAARGLDIPEVSHVFNFDVPVHAEDYVHRIGRTGRAGRKGSAFMIVTPADQKGFEAIEELIGETISWDGEPVEWDEYAGRRRGRGGKGKAPAKSGGRDAKGGRGGRGKGNAPAEKTAGSTSSRPSDEAAGSGREDRQEERPRRDRKDAQPGGQSAGKSGGKSGGKPRGRKDDDQKDLVRSDDDHPFGGEEHVPAFLR